MAQDDVEKGTYLAGLSPITQEVQQREEQTAAQEALIGAHKSDAARRKRIMEEAQTGGRRQAAEGLLQGTRGVETGTGVQAGLGRQAAADVLFAEQQLAATTAAETPATDLANIEATVLAAVQALGTDMTDRVGKMTTYAEIINSYAPGSAEQDKAIDSLMALETAEADPDWWVIQQLNNQRSTINPAYDFPEEAVPGGWGDQPYGGWYKNEDGYWVKNELSELGGVQSYQVYQGEGAPPDFQPGAGPWTSVGNGWYVRTVTDESGNPSTEQQYSPGGPPAG